MQAISFKTVIPKDRKLSIELPPQVPTGAAELVVIVSPASLPRGKTAGDLLNSPLVGMWKGRTDITDTIQFARELRKRGEARVRG